MAVLRLIGSALILVGVIALVTDITRFQASRRPPIFASMERHLTETAPLGLAAAKSAIERAHPIFWDPLVTKVLQLPTWLALGASGAVLCYAGRRRKRVNIFTN